MVFPIPADALYGHYLRRPSARSDQGLFQQSQLGAPSDKAVRVGPSKLRRLALYWTASICAIGAAGRPPRAARRLSTNSRQ